MTEARFPSSVEISIINGLRSGKSPITPLLLLAGTRPMQSRGDMFQSGHERRGRAHICVGGSRRLRTARPTKKAAQPAGSSGEDVPKPGFGYPARKRGAGSVQVNCSSSPSSKATCSSSSAASSAQRSRSSPDGRSVASLRKWSRVRRSISSATWYRSAIPESALT